ncbi:MAG TPA: ribosome recycling factor [Candidatus Vogelbacteria bacterium]|nr:ribosome recycling factor [Candidatus Vogelbacteria bacterium]
MSYSFQSFKEEIKNTEEWLKKELQGIRTGRATPAILDGIIVESYGGAKSPLKTIASVSVEDAKTLLVSLWDSSLVNNVQKAIEVANLGLSVLPAGSSLRVIFPDLTTERRTTLIKMVNNKLEEAKVSLKKEREKIWQDIQNKNLSGEISDDEKYRLKEDLQKMVDESNKSLEDRVEQKVSEIKI